LSGCPAGSAASAQSIKPAAALIPGAVMLPANPGRRTQARRQTASNFARNVEAGAIKHCGKELDAPKKATNNKQNKKGKA
jgi:hypothetical protein